MGLGDVPPTSTLHVGLVAYWKLDETSGDRLDSVGGYTLTAGAFGGPDSAAGKRNLCASNVAANSDSLVNAAFPWNRSQVTVAGWLKLPSPSTYAQVLNSGSSDTRCAIGYNNSTKKVNAYINTRYGLTDANLITTGGSAVWHHLAVVFDGTYTNANAALQNAGRMKIYIDGVSVALTFPAGDIDSSTGDVSGISIGRAGSTSMTQLTDETGIWSRPLSQAEISLLQSVYPV